MPFAEIRGIRIYFERGGNPESGRRLLLVNGSGGDLRQKPNILEGSLAQDFDLLAYDQRGLGQTSKPPGPYSMADYAADALALLPAPSVVREVLWRADFTVSLRQVASYGMGRCFLAGDAAHIHSPAGGRGMNLGIEDAAELARRIMNGGLDGYSDARYRAGARVVRESDWQFRMAARRNPVAIGARNAVVRYGLGLETLQKPFRLRMAGL